MTPETVAQYIDERISRGALASGGKVPTERALAELLGSSRHDVRRQLDALEAEGRVTRQVGRGTFLATEVRAGLDVSLSPLDLIEARLAWEPNLMTLVAVAATAEDFDEIRRAVDNGEAATDPQEFLKWDMAFHRALALATHNTVVAALNDMVEDGRRRLTGGGLDKRRYTIENCAVCQREHREIAEAVFDRDAARSHAAMRSHLQTVRQQMLS